MNFAELKDRFLDAIKSRWNDFQESGFYIQLREKYDDLSPTLQKLVQVAGVVFVVLLLVMMPWSWKSSSDDSLESFENRKSLIRSLLQLKRDLQQAPQIPPGIASSQLKGEVQTALQTLGLTTVQIKGVEEVMITPDKASQLIPSTVEQSGVQVQVWKINLTQFIDLSYKLQRLNNSAKLMSIDMKANSDDPHYYDVIYQVVSFSPPKGLAKVEADEKDEKSDKE